MKHCSQIVRAIASCILLEVDCSPSGGFHTVQTSISSPLLAQGCDQDKMSVTLAPQVYFDICSPSLTSISLQFR